MKITKKNIIFIITFLLLIISVVYRILNPFVQPRIETLTFTGKKAKTEKEVEHTIVKTSRIESQSLIDTFINKPKISGKVESDLFAIYKAPLEKQPEPSIIRQKPEPVEKSLPVNNPLLDIKKYITSYRLYGSYEIDNKRAVFLGKDKLVLVAKTGDRLDGKYLISDIQENFIKIKVLDLNETIHLDMREFNNE